MEKFNIYLNPLSCFFPLICCKRQFMKNNALDSILSSSVTGERIERLLEAYSLLEKEEGEFCRDFSVHCTSSCGECCRHYVPYLTEEEAELCAYFLIKEGREEEILSRLSSSDRESGICPLYNPDKPEHCAFYRGRSMVCRLFGSSVSLDKNGEPAFRDCRWKKDKRVIPAAELERRMDEVPVMSVYGEVLEGEEGESIYTSLPKAVNKIKLLLSYSSSSLA